MLKPRPEIKELNWWVKPETMAFEIHSCFNSVFFWVQNIMKEPSIMDVRLRAEFLKRLNRRWADPTPALLEKSSFRNAIYLPFYEELRCVLQQHQSFLFLVMSSLTLNCFGWIETVDFDPGVSRTLRDSWIWPRFCLIIRRRTVSRSFCVLVLMLLVDCFHGVDVWEWEDFVFREATTKGFLQKMDFVEVEEVSKRLLFALVVGWCGLWLHRSRRRQKSRCFDCKRKLN